MRAPRRARAPRVTVLRRHQGRRAERRPDPLGLPGRRRRQHHVRTSRARQVALSREISRRDLLAKAGRIGAGAVVAGALAGPAGAATRRVTKVGKKVPTGGTITWALEQDPGFIAPFGGILTANRWGNELMYESLLEWDPKLNIRPAIASSYQVVSPTRIVWTIRPGLKFSNGQPVTAADLVYSFDLQLNPPLPGSTAVLGQVPAIAGTTAIGKNKLQMDLKQAGRARVRLPRLAALLGDRPEQHVPDPQPGDPGHRHGPVHARRLVRPERPHQLRQEPATTGRRGSRTSTRSTTRSSRTSRPASRRCAPGSIDGATVSPDSARRSTAPPT